MTHSSTTSKQALTAPLIFALALLTAIGSFATDMYLPSLPRIVEDYHSTQTLVQFSLTAYLIGSGIGQLVLGPISDTYGRQKLIVGCTVVAFVSSIACIFSPTILFLILFRFILGLAGGGSTVLARSVVSDLASGKKAAAAYSLLAMVQGVAPVTAPLVGGALADSIGWRGVFVVLSFINLAQLIVAAVVIRESRPVEERTPGDVKNLIRVFIGLFSNRNYLCYLGLFTFSFAALFAYISASPFVFEKQFGLAVWLYSVIFAVNSCAIVISAFINSRLVRSFAPGAIARCGVVMILIAGIIELIGALLLPHLWVVIPGLTLLAGSAALIMGNSSALGADASGKNAGSGLAMMGFLELTVGGLMSPLVGIGSDHRLTMAVVLCVCCVICALSLLLERKKQAA